MTLKVSSENPRYFEDDGKVVLLVGSHTWYNLQEWSTKPFDIDEYIKILKDAGHNYTRGWVCKSTYVPWNDPVHEVNEIYTRTGTDLAMDGKPKYNLTEFNQSYFDTMRERIIKLRDAGIYVSVMMMWDSVQFGGVRGYNNGHCYCGENNINGVSGTVSNIYNLSRMPENIKTLHSAYVKKVLETVGDLSNVFWEVGNELPRDSTGFQEFIAAEIRKYEVSPRPIGFTAQNGFAWGTKEGDLAANNILFNSSADWISPKDTVSGYHTDGYSRNPPINLGDKVIISDTDHLKDINLPRNEKPRLYQQWAWKSFCRGHNLALMDDMYSPHPDRPATANVLNGRQYIGDVSRYASRMVLAACEPSEIMTGYCIFNDEEYLIYQPNKDGNPFTLNIIPGEYDYEWFNPITSEIHSSGIKEYQGNEKIELPLDHEMVLFLKLHVDEPEPISEDVNIIVDKTIEPGTYKLIKV
ncbi:MAG: DUF4038 domain-containing protein [Candidatus Omnitrophica bacterium]|nr:DUF4038 domain-containing protein [Candidatus Omnitrophota bacterium]